MRRDVFQAIADPQRRKIINLLVRQSFSINQLVKNFNISRPAVSKHIKILRECGVVKIRQQGRERFCIANLEKLKTISDWVEKYSIFWINKLD